MATQAEELLEKMKSLPPESLAEVEKLIDSLTARQRQPSPIDDGDDWTEDDLREATLASWSYAQTMEEGE